MLSYMNVPEDNALSGQSLYLSNSISSTCTESYLQHGRRALRAVEIQRLDFLIISCFINIILDIL